MEKNEISIHELKVVNALRFNPDRWLGNRDITKMIGSISERTVRAHTLKLVKLGLLDQAEVFPSHRYKWSDKARKRNAAYVTRIDKAAEVFGIVPEAT
jgi:DNA-binding transcriptional ArsR family regulator